MLVTYGSWCNSSLLLFYFNVVLCYNGPLDESPPSRQAGIVVNWLGGEAGLTLHSLNLMYDEPDTIFNALREVFRPKGNRIMSRFKFKSLKQKHGAIIDAYMAELKVLIKGCGYDQNMQQILLKDQFIFEVTIHGLQEHLLNDIEDDHDLNHCLQEARKIESHIAQGKLLGLKSVQYDAIGNQRDWEGLRKNHQNQKIKDLGLGLSLELGTASTVVQIIHVGNLLLMEKIARYVAKKTILPKSAGLEKAKAKVLVLLRNHSNIERLT